MSKQSQSKSTPSNRLQKLQKKLKAYESQQAHDWEGLDEMAIVRFVLGRCDVDESQRIEAAMRRNPLIRDWVDFTREVGKRLPGLTATTQPEDSSILCNDSVVVPADSGLAVGR